LRILRWLPMPRYMVRSPFRPSADLGGSAALFGPGAKDGLLAGIVWA
jgi:hypothetical protein